MPSSRQGEGDGYALLEARHIDALTAACRSLASNVARLETNLEPKFTKLMATMEAIERHTAAIPELLRVLTEKATNGDADALAEKANDHD